MLSSLYSDDGWQLFIKQFASSVKGITGQELDVKLAIDGADSNAIVEEELEVLRAKVDELSDEVSHLTAAVFAFLMNCIASSAYGVTQPVKPTACRNEYSEILAPECDDASAEDPRQSWTRGRQCSTI